MKQNLFIVMLAAVVLACPASVMAQKKGKKPAKTQVEKKDTLTILTEQANAGDAKAQNDLGLWYYTGKNVEKNYEKALKYFAAAAKQNNVEAIGNMAMCYQLGRGTKGNKADSVMAVNLYKKSIGAGNTNLLNQHQELADKKNNAFSTMLLLDYYTEKHDNANMQKYLKKASALGNTESQVRLAMLYLNNKNTTEAAKLYKILADKDNMTGVYYYGYMTFKGMGVTQDKAKGIQYLTRAANKNMTDAYRMLGRIYYEGDGADKDVKTAVEYLKKAAAGKRGDSQLLLSQCYQKGEGVNRDFDQAAQWMAEAFTHKMEKEARQQLADEKDATFRNYIDGLKAYCVDQDYEKATSLFKSVEKAGVSDGAVMMAVVQADGNNPKANAKKAFKALSKVENSCTAAKYQLALMYQDGTGVEKDAQKAASLLQAAADAGNGYAQEKVGTMFFEGHGVTQDYVKAAEYYLLAEAQSKLTPASAANLAKCYEMGISSLPDKGKSKERIEKLKKVTATNHVLDMLKKL